MYFEPRIWEQGAPVTLSAKAKVKGKGYAADVLKKMVAERGKEDGTVLSLRLETKLPAGMQVEASDETYAIEITETEAVLYGETDRARIYAAVTLQQMENHEGLFTGRLEDKPDAGFRGYRVYLPGRKSFQEFFNMIDTIVYYKYNHISFEIGGAMEYKSHPEINAAWKEFAAETHRYSGRAHEIQNGYNWAKNSIHTDNAEGDILTQDEVRELIAYCQKRGLEVYPETPFLCHSDYICLAHPDLREREEDPYPDTYCPSNPDVYPIVFDILEEVIEVFKPKMVNIGHDEFYTMCLCPRCKGKKPEEVYAGDIIKIHDWLAERGIRTAMWGEKLLPVVSGDRRYGGSGDDRICENGMQSLHPPTYLCQMLLPKDILMFHWFYSFGIQYDYVYHGQGFEVVFGNMAAERLELWRERRTMGVKGGSCSNWGSNHPEYMQRNGQFMHLIFGAFAMCSSTYTNDRQQEILERAFAEAFHLKYGNLNEKSHIVITHSTPMEIEYKVFYDGIFIEDEVYHMGNYEVTYKDGTTALFEVKYGTNISNDTIPCTLGGNEAGFNVTMLDENALSEMAYSTIPFRKNGKTWYKTAFVNPYPEKKIMGIRYIPDTGADVNVLSIEY